VKISPLAVWTPIPWFLAASAAYFGLGPLVYHFGSEESVAYIETFFVVDEAALLRTNLLNAVGILVVASGYLISVVLFARGRQYQAHQFKYVETRSLMFMFLAIGLSIEYAFVVPYRLGLLSWTLPGGIQSLSGLSRVAIILLFLLVHHGFRRYQWLLYGLISEELVTALMTFSKQAVIEVLIAIGLGWYLGRPNLRAMVIGGVAVVLLYVFVLTPFVVFGRYAFSAVGIGTATEVTEVVGAYGRVEKDALADLNPGVQGWWTRLSYSNAQAFAMDAYDHGARGESVELVLYAFMPRLFFADKPLMTPGREFTAIVTGVEVESATAPGIFAEAYWNGGWILVVVVCLYVGVLFAGLTIFAERTVAAERYEYLPIVMIGFSMGYQPNDWFVVTYVGTLANMLVLYVLLRYVVMPLFRALPNGMRRQTQLANP
jgi:hypothetical protein